MSGSVAGTRSMFTAGAPDATASRVWLPAAVVAALMLPSLVWIFADESVWPWDQAWYGEVTLDLAHAWNLGPSAWLQAMSRAIGAKPPLLVWLAQVMVPFSDLLGGVERALLLVNLAANAGTLGLVHAIARRLGASRTAAVAGVVFCGGASLFVGMSHQFFVEPLQGLAVAGLMWLALSAGSAPTPRLVGLGLFWTALNFAVKSSSIGFVGPFVVYILIVRWATRNEARPPATGRDRALLRLGAAVMAATAVWYVINRKAVLQHIIASTVGPEALLYGSQSGLSVKLAFWSRALMQAVTPWPVETVALAALVAAALILALVGLLRLPPRTWIGEAVASRLLYALALAGTVVAGLLAYSLQINEETRFLLPMIPILAVLLAWSLKVFGRPLLDVSVLLVVVAGAIVVEGAAYGTRWGDAAFSPWLKPYQTGRQTADRLARAVQLTCDPAHANRYVIVGVEYPELNANSAEFYATKARRERGHRCYYTSLGYGELDADKAFRRMDELKADFIVTVAPDRLPAAADAFNRVARPVSERLAAGSAFAPVADLGAGVVVYQRR